MTKFIYILILLFAFTSCSEGTAISVDELRRFDSANSEAISDIIASLKGQLGNQQSYVMEYRPKSEKIYFSQIDSNGRDLGYYEPVFSISKKQLEFLRSSIIHEIRYNYRNDEFSMKIFKFQTGQNTIHLIVGIDSLESIEKESTFSKDNRAYFIKNAW